MQSGKVNIFSVTVLTGIIVALGFGLILWDNGKIVANIAGLTAKNACTLEAKICPDGSSVGRSGPKCEFAACPKIDRTKLEWKTYLGNGFTFKYPGYLEKQASKSAEEVWSDKVVAEGYIPGQLILHSQTTAYLDLKAGSSALVNSKPVKIEKIDETKAISLGGQSAKEFTFGCGVDCQFYVLHFQAGKNYYQLALFGPSEGLAATFDQIVASFKYK